MPRYRITLFLLACLPVLLEAHDLWLIPPEIAQVNTKAIIHSRSGMDFPISEHAADPTRFAAFHLRLPDGTAGKLEAIGTEEKSGILHAHTTVPGIYQLGVQTKPKLITLDAVEFNNYLVSDGLPHIYQLRHQEKSLGQPGNERYSKSPKALFRVGDSMAGEPCVPLGLTLEIVPLKNPFLLKAGDALPVKVLFNQQPLTNANLGWDIPNDGPLPTGTARTNAQGQALIPVAQTGLFTIRLTHMTRPKQAEYEWESFWTTLTFRVEGGK